jgi:Endoplasmic Reticulum-Golgi Intermediate Compartment (ERGIC)
MRQATSLGAIMSVLAMSMMAILFFSETTAFIRTQIVTNIEVDDNSEPQIRLNFNITMQDLHCDYVSVDVWDALGTNRQNITKNVDKWQLDSNGMKRIFSGRNREARELNHDPNAEIHYTVSESGELEAAVTTLTKDNFADFLQEHEMAFIDLYAPWYVRVKWMLVKLLRFFYYHELTDISTQCLLSIL